MTVLRDTLLLTIVCAVLYVPGAASIPLYTRGEPREAQVVRSVATGGPWLVPMRPNGKLTRKPPLYYWLGAASWAAMPATPERAVRMPSIAGGTAGVLATYGMTALAFGRAAALPSALVLATAFEWLRSSTRARIDMTLAAPLALLLLAWAGALAGRRRWPLPLATATLTLAVLAKGPVALVLAAGTAAVTWWLHRREVRAATFVLPLALAAVLAGLWYAIAWLRLGADFADVVLRENVGRFLDASDADAGHEHGILYLLALGLVGLLPWTPLLPLAAGPIRELRRSAVTTLLVAWPIVVIGFFALSSGKRSVYLLPAFPALAALLGAGTVLAGERAHGAARRLAVLYAPGLLLLCAFAALTAAGIDWSAMTGGLLTDRDRQLVAELGERAAAHRAPIALMALATLAAAGAVETLRRRSAWRSLVLVLAALMVVLSGTFQTTLHPAIGRGQSFAGFLTSLAPVVAGEPAIYMPRPVDPEVGYYAPLPVKPWPQEGLAHEAWLLVWQANLAEWTDATGAPLAAVARSDVERGRRGALVLVRLPRGTQRRDAESIAPPAAGSR